MASECLSASEWQQSRGSAVDALMGITGDLGSKVKEKSAFVVLGMVDLEVLLSQYCGDVEGQSLVGPQDSTGLQFFVISCWLQLGKDERVWFHTLPRGLPALFCQNDGFHPDVTIHHHCTS